MAWRGWFKTEGITNSARKLYEESLALAEANGDRGGISRALNNLGTVAAYVGDLDDAERLYEASLSIERELGNVRVISIQLSNIAGIARLRGDDDGARSLLKQSIEIRRRLGESLLVAGSFNSLAAIDEDVGDPEAACRLYSDALQVTRLTGDPGPICFGLEGIASVTTPDASQRPGQLLAVASALRASGQLPLPVINQARHELRLATVRDRLGENAFTAASAAGRAMTMEDAIALALEVADEHAPLGTEPLSAHRSGIPTTPR